MNDRMMHHVCMPELSASLTYVVDRMNEWHVDEWHVDEWHVDE